MDKKFNRDILLTNPNTSELQHVYSLSENHHVFNITIMCIKYKVEIVNGKILFIDYHEDYAGCFRPLLSVQRVSDTIRKIASSIIEHYLNEHVWLKGWSPNWSSDYIKLWNSKMNIESDNTYHCCNPEDSFTYYIFKSNQNTTLLYRVC